MLMDETGKFRTLTDSQVLLRIFSAFVYRGDMVFPCLTLVLLSNP